MLISAILLAAAIWVGLGRQEAVPASAPAGSDKPVFSVFYNKWSDVLTAGIPKLTDVMAKQADQAAVKHAEKSFSFKNLVLDIVYLLTRVDVEDMRTVLRDQIPLLSAVKAPGAKWSTEIKRPQIHFRPKTILPVDKPLVGIYHTHTSESFVPTSGVTHRRGGQAGEIVAVGESLVRQLAEHKIQSIQSKQIHDFPSFMKAYGPSEVTIKKMLADHPSLQIVLDIHRDAEKRENVVAEIDGITVARIAIVVAVGQEDLVQPHWQKNLAFAREINDKMNKYFPGLSRGIQTVDWRYNQHLHERALLLEVGSQETSLEEAEQAMQLFGGILAEILAENNNFGVR